MSARNQVLEMFKIELPIILAPMAGPGTADLAIAVSEAGGLGSLPCAMLAPDEIRLQVQVIRRRTSRPLNLNFFCHSEPAADPQKDAAWKRKLEPYYRDLGLDPGASVNTASRTPFSEVQCKLVEELKPEAASFHFGLPEAPLLARVKAAGCKVISSATTVAEAKWLEARGADAIIAQGAEAGGHRGMFLSNDLSCQPGTMALTPQVADAVKVPVIAAGGIGDARGMVAAFALGAQAVQLGTAYLFCAEAKVSPPYAKALSEARDDGTVITNIFSGRPARGLVNRAIADIGAISNDAPAFPLAASAWVPLRAKAEASGDGSFSPLWAGQAAGLGRSMPAAELTRRLAAEAVGLIRNMSA